METWTVDWERGMCIVDILAVQLVACRYTVQVCDLWIGKGSAFIFLACSPLCAISR